MWNFAEVVKFSWNCEIMSNLWNLPVKFGYHCEIWLKFAKLWNLVSQYPSIHFFTRIFRPYPLHFTTLEVPRSKKSKVPRSKKSKKKKYRGKKKKTNWFGIWRISSQLTGDVPLSLSQNKRTIKSRNWIHADDLAFPQ